MKSIPHSATATVSSTMCVVTAAILLASAAPAAAQVTPEVQDVTFTRDIAPILQRSCQRCHRHEAAAPMSLLTYEDARPWARSIKYRTGLRNKPEAMPPWYIEKDVGIQRFKGDLSLTEEEIAKVAWWADNGAPRGNPADLPPPLEFTGANEWQIGEPDLILSSQDIEVAARAPDWWGPTGEVATGLIEDRHVAAMEMKEIGNAEPASNKQTVGGSYVIHHMVITAVDADGKPVEDVGANVGWPAHEVGRNADFFPPEAGRLLKAGSKFVFPSTHLHSNGRHTVARLDIGLKFHPRGYKPKFALKGVGPGTPYIDLRGMEAGQKFEALTPLMENTMLTVFEPHLHAAGVRMCLEAIWGAQVETLNCARLQPQLGDRLQLRGRCHPAAAEGHYPPRHGVVRHDAGQQEHCRPAELDRHGAPFGRPDAAPPGARHRAVGRGVRAGDGRAAPAARSAARTDRPRLSALSDRSRQRRIGRRRR